MNLNILMFFTDSVVYVSLLFIPLYLWGRDKKEVLLYFFIFLIDFLVVYGLKYMIGAPRPGFSLVPIPTSPSFPSMHSSLGFMPLGFFFNKKKLRIPLFVYGALIAYSRVYIGVHYWLDVIVGSFIGFFLSFYVYQKREKIYKFFSESNKK
ncbi:MAG: phosphatase PAP2 family protein [Candidatus Aenigmarchaeota archaeon]|nr:phosphatase PAP2 family protein [Candidatus Aenigmarchaeota archaeon]